MTAQRDAKASVESVQHHQMNLQAWRTAFNIVLLFIIFRDVTVVRSDGPSGFGELAFKGVVFFLALIFLFINFIVKRVASYRGRRQSRLGVGDVITTFWLVFFSAISIADACSDDKGYCRHWSLFDS